LTQKRVLTYNDISLRLSGSRPQSPKQHLAGNRNPADGPSRWSDYYIGYERPNAWALATLAPVEPPVEYCVWRQPRLQTHWIPTWQRNSSISQWSSTLTLENGIAEDAMDSNKDWKVVSEALIYEGRIYTQYKYHYWMIFQRCNHDHWWAEPAEFSTKNWESSRACTVVSIVSMTGYWDAYKLDRPIAMAIAMVMIRREWMQSRTR